MRDDICTIPISEVFEVNDGCPLCRLHNTVNERIVDYIMGDAMMEPDVRIETNKIGFCPDHYSQMLNHNGRLALALMLQTHLNEINTKVLNKKITDKLSDKCFICDKIEWGFSRMIDTLYRTYENDADFREMFNSQKEFCLPHFELLISGCNKKNMKKQHSVFAENLIRITKQHTTDIYDSISKYCSMYDYRSNRKGEEFESCKTSVEAAIDFLAGK